ncbi:family 10 glycosylhydrolase [Candidatus Sumerlaeota bacterium]|nr:family 10 glycosylhydrolase [Candidatus Sumerlaeota bacterium]
MKNIFFIILFLSIMGARRHGEIVTTGAFRGLQAVYLRPEILTEEATDSYMAEIRSWGAREVFLEVVYNNRALNHSKIFPVMDKEKDWFGIFCGKAKKYNLRIHAWVKVCYWVHKPESISEFPILARHPEWIDLNKGGNMVSSQGNYEDMNFIFINPAAPEARETQLAYVRELCSYDIGGISLDYIRFKAAGDDPETWYGYNPYSVNQFKEKTGLNPHAIQYDLSPGSDFLKWARYNEGIMENCVRGVAEAIGEINRKENRNIVLSASPFTGYETGKSPKYQNWKSWDEKGYIGLWMPMCMSVDMDSLEEEIRGVRNLGLKSPYYPVVYPNQHGALHPPLKDHQEVLEKCGVEKYAVFSYKQLKQEYEKNPRRGGAAIPPEAGKNKKYKMRN